MAVELGSADQVNSHRHEATEPKTFRILVRIKLADVPRSRGSLVDLILEVHSPKAQNSPKALHYLIFSPKSRKM